MQWVTFRVVKEQIFMAKVSITTNQITICAVIVLFRPDIKKLELLLSKILSQVTSVVIVDNGSDSNLLSTVLDKQGNSSIVLLPQHVNCGVAAGHNRGIEWAQAQDHTHVLLLDQDSIPADNMVSELLSALAELTANGHKVSAVGPRCVDPITHYSTPFVEFGRLKYQLKKCMTGVQSLLSTRILISSGALIPMESIKTVGIMDEDLFIDLVDIEWFLRAEAKGLQAFGVCDAVMQHSLGDRTIRVWLGRWQHIPYHSPVRHYYLFRNSAYLYSKSYLPIRWKVINTIQLAYIFLFFSLATSPRLKHMQMMLKGLRDGFRGKMGPIER